MRQLDLRGMDKPCAKTQFGLNVNGQMISYAYIRKNACSAFKKLFQALSPFQEPNAMMLMSNHHRLNLESVKEADLRLCVLRDSEDRIRSLYRNKFIQRSGHNDIFASYANMTGLNPETASYRDFVTLYLSHELHTLDPHTHTQISSLMPVQYNYVLNFLTLSDDIAAVLGSDISMKFFAKPTNSTSAFPKYSESIVDTGAHILSARFSEFREMPDDASFTDNALSQALTHIYADDIKLLTLAHQNS